MAVKKRMSNVLKYLIEVARGIAVVTERDGLYGDTSIIDLGLKMRFCDIHRKYKRIKTRVWEGKLDIKLTDDEKLTEALFGENGLQDDFVDLGNYAFLSLPVMMKEYKIAYKKADLRMARDILVRAIEAMDEYLGVSKSASGGHGVKKIETVIEDLVVNSMADEEEESFKEKVKGKKSVSAKPKADISEGAVMEAAFDASAAVDGADLPTCGIIIKMGLETGQKVPRNAVKKMLGEKADAVSNICKSQGFMKGEGENREADTKKFAEIAVKVVDYGFRSLGLRKGETVSEKVAKMSGAEDGSVGERDMDKIQPK